MLAQKSLRSIHIIGLLLIMTALISLFQTNSEYSRQLHETQSIVDELYLEIIQIRDQLNETITKTFNDTRAAIVIRIDDVSSYSQDALIEILEFHLANEIPASLGIIPTNLGSDEILLDMLDQGVRKGFEICSHGWEHENFTEYQVAEQIWRLNQSKTILDELLGVDITVFIPPHYEFNTGTIHAMNKTGFSIISASMDEEKTLLIDKIISYSATVSFSLLQGEEWTSRNKGSLISEIMENVEKYGYAVIVTHPQEFLKDGEIDHQYLSLYKEFIRLMDKTYHLTTFSELHTHVR